MPVGRRLRVTAVALSGAMALCVLVPVSAAGAAPGRLSTDKATVAEGADTEPAATEEEALARARRTGEAVEVASLRSETAEVFATASGVLEAREYLRPIRARVDGAWKAIDTDLAKSSDGMVAPKVTTVELEFSGGGGVPLVRMTRAGRELALSWPKTLPAPQLDGDTATYPEVLPDVDLRMAAQEDGFTQLLVVKSAEAAASKELAELRLELDASGMDVKEDSSGGLEAVDRGAGGAVFEAPQPVMWDSSAGASADPASTAQPLAKSAKAAVAVTGEDGEPGATESGKLAPVAVEVTAEQNELVLTPDAEVLKGEDTVYPVFIDPQWYTPPATSWTMASKYWASSPQWKFNGASDAGMGFCDWAHCAPSDTKRLFYQFPVSKFAGKSVLSAEFVVRNTSSASCNARGVQLWRTKGISSSTTWNSQNASGFWIDHLATESFAHGYDGCAAKDAEFSVRAAVQQAADKRWSTMTFGLQASSETDAYGWKRFSDDAYLRVKYNRPPTQLKTSQLTMEYGGSCKKSTGAAHVRTLGKIYANNVTDPDGDSVSVQFQAKWDGGSWSPAKTTAKKSGSTFAISLPTTIPPNKVVNWYVRAYDGAQYSPWSYAGDPAACYFMYDTKVPKAPTISSGEYPASDPENPDDPWYDGVGRYGSFEVKAADTDVTTYWYGVNGDPVSKNKLTTSGGAAQIAKVLPAKPGVNFFTAQAFDTAGNDSEIRTYQYRVKAGQPERATWQLDEAAGAGEGKGSTPPRKLALNGGTTLGVEGVQGTAVQFNGTDAYAATDLPPVNTGAGFAVSAWVKLDKIPTGTADVALAPGNNAPGFELYYSTTYGWSFNQYNSDDSAGGLVRADQGDTSKVKAGAWTHLVGSYSSTNDLLQLYVDGVLAESVAHSTPWEARRGLQIGGKKFTGAAQSFFPGAIDALQIFDKPLAQDEVGKLNAKQTVGDPGRPAIAVFDLDESPGDTEITGHGGVLPAKYNGSVTTGVEGIAGKAARFDGTSGYAKIGQTSGPHVNTSRPFTVSAWAKLDKKPTGAGVIAAQAGKDKPGFELYYSAAYDRWAFNQYSADAADATPVRAMQPDGTTARAGEWVHLVGVHDAVADTLTLYVNGVKSGSTTLAGAFYADQSMYIGASNYSGAMAAYFPGSVDDVRVLDRPVSAEEVQQMYKQRPLVKGRWKFESASGTPLVTPDASATANAMTLNGGAKIGSGWVDGGLELDGVDDYGTTATTPVDTSGSFTASAWAQAAALPQDGVTLLSVPGATQNSFKVSYEPSTTPDTDPGRWRIVMASNDTTAATVVQVDNGQFFSPTDWTHLAVVYDGFTKQLSLYVNGELEEFACADDDGNGDADDTTCADRLSWADDVLTFKATQPLQLGRARTGTSSWGEYWPGAVSDVWTFQGALTGSQIAQLAVGQPGTDTDVPGDG